MEMRELEGTDTTTRPLVAHRATPPGSRPLPLRTQRYGLFLLRTERGIPVQDPYVRRYWAAAIGQGAVADLLRLTAAARAGKTIFRPRCLRSLIAARFVFPHGTALAVVDRVPMLPDHLVARLPLSLRTDHRSHLFERKPSGLDAGLATAWQNTATAIPVAAANWLARPTPWRA